MSSNMSSNVFSKMPSSMSSKQIFRRVWIAVAALASIGSVAAQTPAAPGSQLAPLPHVKQIHLKHVLVVGQTKGFEHDTVSAAMYSIYRMGKETGL